MGRGRGIEAVVGRSTAVFADVHRELKRRMRGAETKRSHPSLPERHHNSVPVYQCRFLAFGWSDEVWP